MDFSGENSGDSVEISSFQLLSSMMPIETCATQMTVTDPSAIMNGTHNMGNNDIQRPYVTIVEQPQQRGFRFRYECEGPSHGGLQGEKTERSQKTYPSIRIENYDGPAEIEVSLVTDENVPRIHAHKLVGKNCKDGVCKMVINSTASDISFPNLCVLHVTRKKAAEVLLNRIVEDMKLNKRLRHGNMMSESDISDEENLNAKKQAQDQARGMALNVVRLKFRVFLHNSEGQFLDVLDPVISQPIYDSKSPGASTLKICRMDKYGGCCTGNEEVFLLCERVQKEDIAVRFVECNSDGSVKWQAYGNFSAFDVHRQYAIVFKTPAYHDTNIDRAVNVMIMLQRKSDLEVSEAKAFTYYPQNKDKDLIARKKRKKMPLDSSFSFYPGDGCALSQGGGMSGGFGYSAPDGGNGRSHSNGQSNYSVIMPNGSIVEQLNVLPTPVEQVVKEEMAQSPEMVIPEELYQNPFDSPYNPMAWDKYLNDLEIDAAPSLRHQPQRVSVKAEQTPRKWSHIIPDAFSEKFGSDIQGGFADKLQREEKNSVETVITISPNQDDFASQQEKKKTDIDDGPSPKRIDSSCSGTDPTKSGQSMENTSDEVRSDSHCTTENIQKEAAMTKHFGTQAEENSDKEEHSENVLSSVHSGEATASEGFKTDEGFSEASSMKEEPVSKNMELHETKILSETESGEEREGQKERLPSDPAEAATVALKRAMQQITAKMVLALQDFSETSDARYLLIWRHLTAVKNENGDLPIHLAVINNQTSSLHQLLDVMMSLPFAGRSINSFNYMRQTALHLAAIMQQSFHIKLLLHAGADPSLADRNGNTPAHLAVINNSVEALSSLVKYLRPGVTAADPFPELDYLNYDGYTPVHLAAQSGNVDLLRLLVCGQANVDIPDGKSGRTALHHAVELDDLPMAGFLLMEAGADVNACCFDGNTPLHIACCRGLIGMVALLMTAGALTDVENEDSLPEDSEMDGVEGEEGSHKSQHGFQPRDYASGKDRLRILSMLMGDPDLHDLEESWPDRDLVEDIDGLTTIKSTYDSAITLSLSSQSGPISSLPRKKLSNKLQEELSKLLDPRNADKDVFALASRLGYDSIVPALEVMGLSGSSPTQYLLDYHETYGSVDKLKECLQAMERDDAIQLIDSGI